MTGLLVDLVIAPTIGIASLKARLSVDVAGALQTGTFRYTRLWQRSDNGSWRSLVVMSAP